MPQISMYQSGVLVLSEHNNSDDSFCRLCGGDNNERSTKYCNVFDGEGLVDLIDKYLCIKISTTDTLPLCICDECKYKIESFHEYAIRCQDLQQVLQADTKKFSIADGTHAIHNEQDVVQDTEEVLKDETDIKHENFNEEYDCKDDFDFCDEDILPLSESVTNKVKKKRKGRKKNTAKDKTDKDGKVVGPSRRETRRSRRINKCNGAEDSNNVEKPKEEEVDGCVEKSNENEVIDEVDDNAKIHLEGSYIVYKCHVCTEILENWCDLEKHVTSKHFVKPKVMCICNQTLGTVNAIMGHISKHGKNITSHSCDKCNKTYLKKNNYLRHMARHGEYKDKSQRLYECKKCKSYARHMIKHQDRQYRDKVKCSQCDKVFATIQTLKGHVQTVHEKIRPFVCDVCGHAFYQKCNLTTHMEQHKEKITYHCDYCPRKFTSKRYLREHLLCHSGVSYKCPVCQAIFNYKNTLTNHMYTHQDVNRFVCGFCNKGFKWRSSLQTHVNIHTGATPYACPWCPKTFSDRSNCRLHKRKNHPQELAEYEKKNGIVHHGKTKQFTTKDASVVPLKDPSKIKFCVFPKVSCES